MAVVRWTQGVPPSEQEVEAHLHKEGYRQTFRWTDVPGSNYPKHHHSKDECIWVISGEITLSLDGKDHTLRAGDKIYLPKGKPHAAAVPASGSVTYIVGEKD